MVYLIVGGGSIYGAGASMDSVRQLDSKTMESSPSAGAKPRQIVCVVPTCNRPQAIEEMGWEDGSPLCDMHVGTVEGRAAAGDDEEA